VMAHYRTRSLVCYWFVTIAVLFGCTEEERQGESRTSSVAVWQEGPPLPHPTGNNAVAAVAGADGVVVLSILGIDSTKIWSGVSNAAYRWDVGTDVGWREIDPLPGSGRLAPTVQVVDGRVFVFGGYTVAEDGAEASVPDVNVYDPVADTWSRAADIPLPVDDAVSGLWRDSLVYLVSGWHDTGNVRDVQIFDPYANVWSVGTPIPGAPVFGHSGAIVGDDFVFVGGTKIVDARPRFVVDSAAWRGRIDPLDPTQIAWEPLDHPPGPPLYRAAAGSVAGRILLVGGTANPYNYDGVGYDGESSNPVHQIVSYDRLAGWSGLEPPPVATMDHRTLGVAGGYVFLVGGMEEGQVVSGRVWYSSVELLIGRGAPP
jgi:hypothetical protein